MKRKIYVSPDFSVLSMEGTDILTASPNASFGVDLPFYDEDPDIIE